MKTDTMNNDTTNINTMKSDIIKSDTNTLPSDRKMIFLDLDGTLFDDKKNIPPANAQAISEALAQGHKVIICTGRPLCSAGKLFAGLGMEREGCYAITYNGGLIYDIYHRETLFKQTLPLEYVHYIFDQAGAQNVYMQTYTDDAVLCLKDTQEGRDYAERLKIDRRIVPDVFEVLGENEPCKTLAIAENYNRSILEAFRELLQDWASDKVDIFFSGYEYLELVPKGISKGAAIRFLADYLHIHMENTIAVGDAENDIPMIQAAGLGVVMKNAAEDIKIYADYITELDNNAGGVAEVIRKFMLQA